MSNPTESEPERKLRKGEPCPLIENGKMCGEPVFSSGWCSKHYSTWYRYGDPQHPVKRRQKQGDKCTAPEGCDKKPQRHQLCVGHARLQELYGETTDPRERRFWAKVDRSGGLDACWPWLGWCQDNGYGQYGSKGKGSNLAHRIAYEYLIGPIPDGKMLDHLCHTRDPECPGGDSDPHRKCCNPRHADPTSARENIARGRGGDSWGYEPDLVPVKYEQLTLPICAGCGRSDKPIYKSRVCRPCYRKRMKDPTRKRRSQLTVEERFREKIDKNGPPPYERLDLGPCWLWTAGINKGTGYGSFARRHGEGIDAHRFSYELAHGSIPERHDVHHMCLRRACVNPAHLEAVTRSVNLAERMNRRSR